MDAVSNLTRISPGSAYGRSSGVGPVAPPVRNGNDSARSPRDDSQSAADKHEKIATGGHAVAAKIKTKTKVEEPREQPEAVTIDPMFDRRIGNARGGIFVDLVYRNTNFRAVRLFGPTSGREEQALAVRDSGVTSGDAARAYAAGGAGGGNGSSTVLTG